ncbi:hypothetical protein HYFRA_00001929 [Hymenoscyphus fraxineus]|uniref:Uncharacterized protein n=1 Tax=Hymenoscyphus fraxineus TaxID=746836 RepID=A0A9N9KKW5_9HELO|nr:hypothetical protein HYFRA_00001929 [Hymenoscyphus fraxineus]
MQASWFLLLTIASLAIAHPIATRGTTAIPTEDMSLVDMIELSNNKYFYVTRLPPIHGEPIVNKTAKVSKATRPNRMPVNDRITSNKKSQKKSRLTSSTFLPRLAIVWAKFVPIFERDIMIKGPSVASRVIDRKLTELSPISAHANLAYARGIFGRIGVRVQMTGITRSIVSITNDILSKNVETMSDVFKFPSLMLLITEFHKRVTKDKLREVQTSGFGLQRNVGYDNHPHYQNSISQGLGINVGLHTITLVVQEILSSPQLKKEVYQDKYAYYKQQSKKTSYVPSLRQGISVQPKALLGLWKTF